MATAPSASPSCAASGFDAKHLDETKLAINCLVKTPEDLAAVVQGRRMTIFYYAQMFTECLQHPYASPSTSAPEPERAEMEMVAAE